MIDIHCHVLPGIDDGSRNIDMSVEMLRIAEENGTKKMIATPHYYRGSYENEFEDVLGHVENLNAQLKTKGINVEIFPGQEVFVDRYTLEAYKSGIIHPLNASKYMLIEFPMDVLPDNAIDIIYELKILGVKPIVAHPERYLYINGDLTNINKFIEEGCLFQLNTTSIMGLMGKRVKEAAYSLMDNGLCHFIASDAHSTERRCPNLGLLMGDIKKDYEKIYNSVQKNAQCILDNEEIDVDLKKIEKKKGLFSFFFNKK
ncbi:capsular polysaccharide biosynthesis protein [Clostridium pasteurianum DSM 525 = ATCC 6013]|uniref:protein-tyrosine-phosphatase n=1 Tax=Clostridium pasteurianum DSM 525 = ATCC 6013 TaxID=1262449 RepID=A0A0H3J717_CLOPA|nr:CpsB/CapC family capsule biosynthesis tyrosine phosphatase [Clostridium pasteurianum]AJA46775.1 capsular polysaccharide biosynthesis protein [Clostridium pasteurianum DSM 525 = ATCC 6013]AJA50763.1 capsular polysaccharide biosynthesis protein [Clostridium pasteurianum DSM 525 = ATCC 6013]AOZ74168.1 exopolysaccharide biosynthesis protein [Clostridium pasteurianum DSM 525 = ATCC 6013]AOZ77966.1 exopolysaccharide biosynthesis protein [Clostridium pasteurianum]ELP58615.1 CpsB protein [Clostridi